MLHSSYLVRHFFYFIFYNFAEMKTVATLLFLEMCSDLNIARYAFLFYFLVNPLMNFLFN